jgi:Ca-activated chloride channel family protein
VGPLSDLPAAIRGALVAWERIRWSELRFAQLQAALLLLAVLVALPLVVMLARSVWSRPRRAARVALPAVLSVMRRSPLTPLRHAALLLFVVGIPFFGLAIADPRTTSVQEQVTYSGRRIAMLIDASGSMVLPFEAPTLEPVIDRTFYTAVAAAERFVKLRMAGQHADRIAVIQFGNEAYVVTPFTTDYDNVLLSLRLIGEPRAWNRFNVFGTTIIQGIEQGMELFKTFNLLDGSDNALVIFSDGNDGETMFRGRTLDAMMDEARQRKIPIFMVRLAYRKQLGDIVYDPLWKSAVERSGGRFYAAADERDILRAVSDIDRLTMGRIAERRSASAAPAFAGYTLIAVALWLSAGTLKLAFPFFRTFP